MSTPSPERSCLAKVRHRYRAAAEKAMAAMLKAEPPALHSLPLTVYRCSHCKGWHFGHKIPRDNPRKRRTRREAKLMFRPM